MHASGAGRAACPPCRMMMQQPALALLLLALPLAAVGEVVWKQGGNAYVRIAGQAVSARANAHPIALRRDDIANALRGLSVVAGKNADKRDSKAEPLFIADQARLLAEHLSMGLQRADADEDVLFSLEKKARGLFGTKSRKLYVAGRAFVVDGRLNVIIGEHNQPVNQAFEQAYDPTRMGIVAFEHEHGTRKAASRRFAAEIGEMPGVTLRRKDWVQIDLRSLVQNDAARHDAAADIAQPMTATQMTTERIASSPQKMQSPSTAPAIMNEQNDKAAGDEKTIEGRLTILNSLKAKGLISDREYTEMRSDILRELL